MLAVGRIQDDGQPPYHLPTLIGKEQRDVGPLKEGVTGGEPLVEIPKKGRNPERIISIDPPWELEELLKPSSIPNLFNNSHVFTVDGSRFTDLIEATPLKLLTVNRERSTR